MNTCIISTFPCCGVTYLCEHANDFSVISGRSKHTVTTRDYKMLDYSGTEKQVNKVIEEISKSFGEVDFIFIPFYDDVLCELNKRGIPHVMVVPNTSDTISLRVQSILKQQWVGRMFVKGYSLKFITKVCDNFELMTSTRNILKSHPTMYYTLHESGYISDIIDTLYNAKEAHHDLCCNKQDGDTNEA